METRYSKILIKKAQEGLTRIFKGALDSKTEEELGKICLSVAEELTLSKFGFIAEIAPDGTLRDIAISDPGWESCRITEAPGHYRPPIGLYGFAVTHGTSLIANDPLHHPESIGIPEGHPDLYSFLGVPLQNDGITTGVIALGNREGGYDDDDREIIEIIAPAIVEAFSRKRSEDALAKSERNYRELVENVNSVVLRWKQDGAISFINSYGRSFFGYGEDEIVGKHVSILVPGHDSEGTDLTGLTQDITDHPERYVSNVNENVRRDGTRVWMSWTNRAIYDKDGALFEILAIGSDITHIKHSEETIRMSEMKLSQAQRIAHLGYWDRDLKTGKVHWSDEVYRIFGLEPGAFEETYDAFLSCIHPEDRTSVLEKSDSLDAPEKLEAEYRVVRPDGSERVVVDRAEVIKGPDGNPAYLMGTVLDITQRKQMEDNLRMARDELELRVKERTTELERQASLLELAHDAIIVRDMENRIIFWNHGAEDMYGWRKNEAMGFIIHGLLETKFPVSLENIMDMLKETGRWEGELEHITKDNRIITVHSRQALQRDDKGRPTGIMEINTDITSARHAEDQLRQSQKMQAIGTLAGGIAHDFNNILASILGYAEMAIDDLSDRPDVEKSLHNVLKSALRARDLVRQILAFSRKTDYSRGPISIVPIIEETIQMLRASIPANIQINLSINSMTDVVVAAPVEIQQILMNLVTNASLAMEEKGGLLEISLADVDLATDSTYQPEEYIELMVRDTGEGMVPEIMKRVFDPFFSTREPDKGTGMGLAVVYGIVKDLQGMITVESKPGQGSIFRVKLPKTSGKVEHKSPEGDLSPGAREKILFVDDEEMLVELGRSMLGRLGYNAVAVSNPSRALEIFSENPFEFDVVITDQAMPGMTGTELIGKILAIRDTMPIILCTGHSEVISSETAHQFGVTAFLMKPLSRKELARAIRAVIEKSGAA